MSALIRTTFRSVRSNQSCKLATMATIATRGQHTLPDLPYAYNALEPSISEEITTLHHKKHHQTYVTGLNTAEEAFTKAMSSGDVKKQIELQAALKFNGGGHINHSLFWKNLSPASESSSKPPTSGPFYDQVTKDFGSFDNLKTEVNAKTAAVQGSGWGWLGWDAKAKKLEVVTTPNQDPLLSHTPILGIGIWEHAFYLQYKNVKPDYLKAIWSVINYDEAAKRFEAAQ